MLDYQATQLQQAVEAVKGRKISNIYFAACGGSKAIFEPVQYIMDREASIPCAVYTSNEFIHRAPKALGNESLVVTCSHSGNTPETVEATKFAREKGALTICFSFKDDSPLWEAAECGIAYTWGPESDAGNSNNAMLFRLVFSLLNLFQPCESYMKAVAALDGLNDILERNKKATLDSAIAYGSKYKREPMIYTMSSGECYGVAYSFAICLLMEMLWIHSNSIHSGEYFHGPFEVTDYDVPFILIKNAGATRPLDERAEKFMKKFSEKVEVIDAASFEMPGVEDSMKGYFAPLVAGAVLRQYADQLAEFKGHPLSVRRYMWKMDY